MSKKPMKTANKEMVQELSQKEDELKQLCENFLGLKFAKAGLHSFVAFVGAPNEDGLPECIAVLSNDPVMASGIVSLAQELAGKLERTSEVGHA